MSTWETYAAIPSPWVALSKTVRKYQGLPFVTASAVAVAVMTGMPACA
ncbi:MAG: hypothetical protein V9G10_14405 [Candidatus Nanopelagicales bacterium]